MRSLKEFNRNLWYAILLSLPFMTSCSKENESEEAAENKVSFIASVSSSQSGNEGNEWAMLKDRRIAVKIDGTIKEYTVDTQGNMTCTDPFLWEERKTIIVDAWYPFNNGEWIEDIQVKADQSISANYEASDFMEVKQLEVSVENPSLEFERRTAKLVCNLTSFDDDYSSTLTVRGVIGVEGGVDAVIMNTNYEARLVPQRITEGTLSLKLVLGDKRSIVCNVNEGFEMIAGRNYYINVEVGENYQVTAAYVGSSADWNDSGDENINGNSPAVTPDGGTDDWNGSDGGDIHGSSPTVTPGDGASADWNDKEDFITGIIDNVNQ